MPRSRKATVTPAVEQPTPAAADAPTRSTPSPQTAADDDGWTPAGKISVEMTEGLSLLAFVTIKDRNLDTAYLKSSLKTAAETGFTVQFTFEDHKSNVIRSAGFRNLDFSYLLALSRSLAMLVEEAGRRDVHSRAWNEAIDHQTFQIEDAIVRPSATGVR